MDAEIIRHHTNRRVRVLDPWVAERIAAGEVIERPASVVKELVENSLDAGATEISILLEDGGKSLIEVMDNGSGIPAEDLPVCIQRHATSKLHSLDDLERITTLGFRGEALPSIGAVADLQILSRGKDRETAYRIQVSSPGSQPDPEAVTFGHFLSSPHGTRIQARGLFSQVPARLKFLKSQSSEVAQVREWIERLALARPEVGFRLMSDRRCVLNLRPQEETARVRSILSDEEEYPIVTSSNLVGFRAPGRGALHVRAHWLQGLSTPQTRKIVQIVNGRWVRDRLLQQAIMTPFRQALLPGQFPAIVIFVDVDPAEIDVNVHPTKTEVRFLDNRKVFHSIESLISSLIEERGAPAFVPQPAVGPLRAEPPRWQAAEAGYAQKPFSFTTPPEASAAPNALQALGLAPDRFVGIAFNTYLIYDLGLELALIDQHAAHERIRYERLRRRALSENGEFSPPQSLLLPESVNFPEMERPTVEKRLAWLEALGFEIEIFGENTLLFRGVPAEWGLDELRIRLKNLVERLISIDTGSPGFDVKSILMDENLFEKLASEACHSAIRAGDRLERIEALELADLLARCAHPWNCPHGRPTIVRVPKGRIEEWFQRRV